MREAIHNSSPLEVKIAFSRAVRIGGMIAISGTAPIGAEDEHAHGDAVYLQTKQCLSIIIKALSRFGCTEADVLRTRVILTDISRWEQAAKAHSETFGSPGPACTFMEVSRFIDPRWLVEIEADAIARTGDNARIAEG